MPIGAGTVVCQCGTRGATHWSARGPVDNVGLDAAPTQLPALVYLNRGRVEQRRGDGPVADDGAERLGEEASGGVSVPPLPPLVPLTTETQSQTSRSPQRGSRTWRAIPKLGRTRRQATGR